MTGAAAAICARLALLAVSRMSVLLVMSHGRRRVGSCSSRFLRRGWCSLSACRVAIGRARVAFIRLASILVIKHVPNRGPHSVFAERLPAAACESKAAGTAHCFIVRRDRICCRSYAAEHLPASALERKAAGAIDCPLAAAQTNLPGLIRHAADCGQLHLCAGHLPAAAREREEGWCSRLHRGRSLTSPVLVILSCVHLSLRRTPSCSSMSAQSGWCSQSRRGRRQRRARCVAQRSCG